MKNFWNLKTIIHKTGVTNNCQEEKLWCGVFCSSAGSVELEKNNVQPKTQVAPRMDSSTSALFDKHDSNCEFCSFSFSNLVS